jgi:putative drug exporter of the RND superfamily
MAALLYRLGRLAFRRRLVVALLWVAVLAGAGVAATRAPAAPPDNSSVPGTESQQANDLLQQSFPARNPNGAIAQIVFVAPHGQKLTSARDQAVIGQVVDEAAATPAGRQRDRSLRHARGERAGLNRALRGA